MVCAIRPPSKGHVVKAKADLLHSAAIAFAENPNDDTEADLDCCAVEYRDAVRAYEAAIGARHSEKVG